MAGSGGLGLQQVQRLPPVLKLPRTFPTGGVVLPPPVVLINGNVLLINGTAVTAHTGA